MLRNDIRIANRVNSLDIDVVRVNVNSIIIAIRILIEIFFCCFLTDKDLVIDLSFIYENSAFIYFLEYLEDCYFVLNKIYIILLYLDSFLDSGNSILDLLLLLLLLLYSSSILIVLLIIIIFAVFKVFSFSEKALA